MACVHCFVVWLVIFLLVQGRWDEEFPKAEDRVKQFTCTHFGFLVTFEINYGDDNAEYISKLLAECSNEHSYLIVDNLGRPRAVGSYNVERFVSTSVPELIQCQLRIYYRSLFMWSRKERNFSSDLSCILPKTEVTATPSLVINSTGTNSTIECSVKSFKYVNIIWMKSGVELEETENLQITYMFTNNTPYHLLSISTISFMSPQLSDAGLYECISNRTDLENRHRIGSESCQVNVKVEFTATATTTTGALHGTSASKLGDTSALTFDGTSTSALEAGDVQDRVLYGVIGTLSLIVLLLFLSLLTLTLYCLWMHSAKSNKLTMHALAIIYPSVPELHDLDLESMKLPEFKVLSDSTNSLFAALDCSEPLRTAVEEITPNNTSHSFTSI